MIKSARIVSTGSYLPGEPLTNETLESLLGPLSPELLEQVQVERRHWLVNPITGEYHETNSDMAAKAAKQALELANIDPNDVDLLVLSTASPDYPLPPMVTLVQEKLGLRRCATLEIRSGCCGTVEALDVARLYLERGIYQTAIVIGSEAISPLLAPQFLGKDPSSLRARDRLNIYSFGDGAAAMVLTATQDEPGFVGSAMACVGGNKKPGMIIPGGGTNALLTTLDQKKACLMELKVDFTNSGKFTPHVLNEALVDVLKRSSTTAESIDFCFLPEGNAGYLRSEIEHSHLQTSEWVVLGDKIFENLCLVSNTGSAAVPLALDYAWKTGKLKSGDRIMLLAIETSKWLYAGIVLDWSAEPCAANNWN